LTQQGISQDVHSIGARLAWPPMTPAQAGPLLGFAAGRKGQALPFELLVPGISTPAGLGAAAGVAPVTNMLKQSERLELVGWTMSSHISLGTGRLGPFGQRQAQLPEVDSTGAAYEGITQDLPAVSEGMLLASAYVYPGTADRFGFNIHDLDGDAHTATWTWDTGAPVYTSGSRIDGYGAISVGSGWWRVWLRVDLAARGLEGHSWRMYLYPRIEPAGIKAGTYIYGVQVEQGASAPGDYLWSRSSIAVRQQGPRVAYRQNYVTDSEDLAESVETLQSAYIAGTAASGPAGATYGPPQLLLADGGASPLASTYLISGGLEDTVASVYVQAAPNCGRVGLTLQDATAADDYTLEVDDLDTEAPAVYSAPDADGWGVDPVAGWPGWWRLWVHLDGTNRNLGSHILRIVLHPDQQARAGYGAYFAGLQLEQLHQHPGPYLPTSGGGAHSTAPGGNAIYVVGLEPNTTGVLLGNDFCKLDGHSKLYQLVDQVDADPHGCAVLQVVPMLRQVPADGEQLQLEDLPLLCTFSSAVQEYSTSKPLLFAYGADVEEYHG